MTNLKFVSIGKIVILLIAIALLHAFIYATLIPPWQMPDEPFHYEYQAELGKKFRPTPEGSPSVQGEIIASMARWKFWRYQNLMTPDPLPWGFATIPFFKTIRYLDRNPTYYYLLLPFYLLFTNHSIELRLFVLRLVNTLFAAATVGLAFVTAQSLFPKDKYIFIGVPALIALLPMFAFIGGSLNNDNLANLLFALFIYLISIGLVTPIPVRSAASFFGAIAIAVLALVTKRSTIALVPLVLVLPSAFLFRSKLNNRRDLVWRLGVVGLEIFFIFLLAYKMGRDPFKSKIQNLFDFHFSLSEIGNRFAIFFSSSVGWEHTKTNFIYLFKGFWGHFGWQNIPLSNGLYFVLMAFTLFSIIGFLRFFFSQVVRGVNLTRERKILMVFMLLSIVLVVAIAFIRTTVFEYVPFQGRYIFPTLIPAAILFVLGLGSFVGSRLQSYLLPVLVIGLVILDLLSWVGYLLPVFYNV